MSVVCQDHVAELEAAAFSIRVAGDTVLSQYQQAVGDHAGVGPGLQHRVQLYRAGKPRLEMQSGGAKMVTGILAGGGKGWRARRVVCRTPFLSDVILYSVHYKLYECT
jgi:hypothetical protein